MGEIVYTVTDFYDGPRGGIANYHGTPHVYRCLWDESINNWTDTFLLQRVDDETFRLAMEDWAIWCRWEEAFHNGETTQETHPALPEERARHENLSTILRSRLQVDSKQAAVHATGRFETRAPAQLGLTSSAKLVVFWSPKEIQKPPGFHGKT